MAPVKQDESLAVVRLREMARDLDDRIAEGQRDIGRSERFLAGHRQQVADWQQERAEILDALRILGAE